MTVSATSPASLRYQTLLQLLRTADVLWTASQAFFGRWDISPSQFNVINVLAGEPRGLSQIEISRLLITHRSNVTGLIDRLEKRGLVLRRNAANDRRAYRVVLTAAGRRLLDRILPEFYELADAVWAGTPAKRARALAGSLEALSNNACALTSQERRAYEDTEN
jgi:DNA-binding MarR family transcriptional regulator